MPRSFAFVLCLLCLVLFSPKIYELYKTMGLTITVVSIAVLIFIAMLALFLQEKQDKKQSIKKISHKMAKFEDLCELYQEAFAHNDFDALQELAKEFQAGEAIDHWEAYPDIQQKIAQAIKKLAELVDSGKAPREAELEDFYYMGLMYEQGFECEPDLDKAIAYFEKALDTENCWSHQPEENWSLRRKVQEDLKEVNSWLEKIQFKE